MDGNELSGYAKKLLTIADDLADGRDMKEFMGKAGNKLKKEVAQTAKRKVKQVTGAYQKSIKRGAVWQKRGGTSVNVYSDDNKAHLIEKGHRIVTKDGKEVGFKKGEYVFSEASDDAFREFEEDVDDFLNGVLKEMF